MSFQLQEKCIKFGMFMDINMVIYSSIKLNGKFCNNQILWELTELKIAFVVY